MDVLHSFFLLLIFLNLSTATKSLQSLRRFQFIIDDGNNTTLVSPSATFELGFFIPSNNSDNRYLGICYKNIPDKTVVWVANRENPINVLIDEKRKNPEASIIPLAIIYSRTRFHLHHSSENQARFRECHRWRSLDMIPAISKAKTPTVLLDLKEVVFFRSSNLGFDFGGRERRERDFCVK